MRNANRRKYHYIYKTTCTVTGRYYIGMHSTDDLNDGYLGSGKRLWYSINKYGKENHVCEILEHYFTREWLREREAELVNDRLMADPMCMNLKVGGEGGWDHITQNPSKHLDAARRGGQARQARQWEVIKQNPEMLAKFKRDKFEQLAPYREKAVKFAKDDDRTKAVGLLSRTNEAKEKRKLAFSRIAHQQGETNSQFGTCWVTKDSKAVKIDKSDLESFLSSGWRKGRK